MKNLKIKILSTILILSAAVGIRDSYSAHRILNIHIKGEKYNTFANMEVWGDCWKPFKERINLKDIVSKYKKLPNIFWENGECKVNEFILSQDIEKFISIDSFNDLTLFLTARDLCGRIIFTSDSLSSFTDMWHRENSVESKKLNVMELYKLLRYPFPIEARQIKQSPSVSS